MKPFKELKEWIRKRWLTTISSSTLDGGKTSDWSLTNFQPSVNTDSSIMLRLPSPVLSIVESYLGSKDKYNLRLTCKLLYTTLPQWELPLYRPHFMPTSTLHASFVSDIGKVVPSPLFLERFQADRMVEKSNVLRSSHSIASACMNCNHYLPHSAVTLPSLAYCGKDQPILAMQHDHHCFHALERTYDKPDRMHEDDDGMVYPQDAVFAVNLLQFITPTEYNSTVFQCCSSTCFRQLAMRMCSSPSPVAVIGQEVTMVQKLDEDGIGVELRYFTYFSRHLSLVLDYVSTRMVVRKFRFRMENFHYRAPSAGYYTCMDFNTFCKITPSEAIDLSIKCHNVADIISNSSPSHMLKAMVQNGQSSDLFRGFPERVFTSEEFSDFVEVQSCSIPPHPFLIMQDGEEPGQFRVMLMTYSFAAIIYNDGLDWCMEAFVADFQFTREGNRDLLRNLRTNLQLHYEQSPLQRGMVGVQGTFERMNFDFFLLSCEESSVVSESEYEYEDLMEEEEEEEEEYPRPEEIW